MTMALSMENPGRTTPLNYIQVVMAWVFDVTCFGVKAKWTDLLGTVLIIGLTLAGAIYKAFKIK